MHKAWLRLMNGWREGAENKWTGGTRQINHQGAADGVQRLLENVEGEKLTQFVCNKSYNKCRLRLNILLEHQQK